MMNSSPVKFLVALPQEHQTVHLFCKAHWAGLKYDRSFVLIEADSNNLINH